MNDSRPPPHARDLAALCQSCGLCCDGSFFDRVDLSADEVGAVRRHRLHIVNSGKSFEQPCAAFAPSPAVGEPHACTIYEERPLSCRRFVCRLYDEYRHERGELEASLSVVRRVRALLASLDRRSPERAARAELKRLLDEHFARV
jgi:Fe-S-cluster containining protein